MPITWRNVGSTVSGAGSGDLMQGAQESMTGGFDALQKVLDNRQKTNRDNWEQGSENNTNALMNKLTGVTDPAQLQAMRERGEFQKLMQGYGAQVDQGAVRDALDGRGKFLRGEVAGQQKHQDDQTRRGNRDLLGEITDLQLQGKYDEAQSLYEANRDSFVDSAGVARDMYGDKVTVNTETRAQRTATRADDRLEIAQEENNRNAAKFEDYTEDREILESDRMDVTVGESVVNDTVDSYRAMEDEIFRRQLEVAEDEGIPIVDGKPDFDSVTDATTMSLFNASMASTMESAVTPTQMGDRAFEQARNSGLSVQDATAARNTVLEQLGALDKLAPQDQERLTQQQSAVTSDFERRRRDLNQRWEKQANNNVFWGDPSSVGEQMESTAQMIESGNFDPMFVEGTNKDDLIREIGSISNGIMDDGELIRVPDAVLNNMMRANVDDWFDPSDGLRDSLTDYIRKNRDKYDAAVLGMQERQAEEDQLNRAELQAMGAVEGDFREESDLSAVPLTEMERTLERRAEKLR